MPFDVDVESVVAPRSIGVARLEQIDRIATCHAEAMIASAESIRSRAAELVVCGVQMAEIRSSMPAVWDEFVKPLGISVKGDDATYREIAHVLFRRFRNPLQGDGALSRRTISRDQICRYGAAICCVHRWHGQGDGNSDGLVARIVASGGVWEVARLEAERRAHKNRRTWIRKPRIPTVLIAVPKPTLPVLVVIRADGTWRYVSSDLAATLLEGTL